MKVRKAREGVRGNEDDDDGKLRCLSLVLALHGDQHRGRDHSALTDPLPHI